MSQIKKILMERDGMSANEADQLIREAKCALNQYIKACNLADAEDICMEYFGLEPDYICELID